MRIYTVQVTRELDPTSWNSIGFYLWMMSLREKPGTMSEEEYEEEIEAYYKAGNWGTRLILRRKEREIRLRLERLIRLSHSPVKERVYRELFALLEQGGWFERDEVEASVFTATNTMGSSFTVDS